MRSSDVLSEQMLGLHFVIYEPKRDLEHGETTLHRLSDVFKYEQCRHFSVAFLDGRYGLTVHCVIPRLFVVSVTHF